MNGDPAVACPLTPAGVAEARRLGELLRDEPLDLCVTSPFGRARQTADEALRGRDVPRLELADLGDPRYGDFEGGTLAAYRAWAHGAPSDEAPAGGGESRRSLAARYAAAFRAVLARPEETVLVVCHALPVAYALAAREGEPPEAVVRRAVAHAEPFPFTAAELAAAASVLEAWVAAPTW